MCVQTQYIVASSSIFQACSGQFQHYGMTFGCILPKVAKGYNLFITLYIYINHWSYDNINCKLTWLGHGTTKFLLFSYFSRQVHLGENLFSEEQKVKILKQQEVAASEYMVPSFSHSTCSKKFINTFVHVLIRKLKTINLPFAVFYMCVF